MDDTSTIAELPARRLGLLRSGVLFVVIGALLYLGVYALSERLVYRTGDSNPFFKIETAGAEGYDWVILGASHAMPLDFADFNAVMESDTGLKILNLAGPGTGPLYNGFVLEHFFRGHRTRNILYVLDSFVFYDRKWNEDRFSDAKLLSRTPFDPVLVPEFVRYSLAEDVDPRASLDFLAGFSKINNQDRFKRDVWEGEAQFGRSVRPSSAADSKRITYLYPQPSSDPATLARYLDAFDRILTLASENRAAVTVIKPPVPPQFYRKLPNEPGFDTAISALLAERGLTLKDYSHAIPEPRRYFDTDHLNRDGLTKFFAQYLKPLLMAAGLKQG